MNTKRIYLDYAATTPLDPRVAAAMRPFFRRDFGNPGSLHREGQRASRAVFLARRTIAGLLGLDPAKGYEHVVFTGSATEANNLALRGAVKALSVERRAVSGEIRKTLNPKRSIPNPRIIISSIEHESVLETARDLERDGIEVIYLPVSRDGVIDVGKLKMALNERTVLVSVMYANNEIGTIQPIAEIAKAVQAFRVERRAVSGEIRRTLNPKRSTLSADLNAQRSTLYPLLHTDAVQAFQYLDCSPDRLGVDLMTLSAHKIYGPKGVGLLYVRNQQPTTNNQQPAVSIQPIITGGGQEFGLRSATENVPLIAGFAEAAKIVGAFRIGEGRRITALREYFLERLIKLCNVVIVNGSRDNRLPNNINVFLGHAHRRNLLVELDLAGIAASVGSACAARESNPSHVLRAIGADEKRARESIRFTLGRPTTRREVNAAIAIIGRILSRTR